MDPAGRDPGWRPGYGDGYYPGDPSSSNSSSSSGGGSLPVWSLVLIMLASGLVTLTFLWLCVLFICRKRRARRAAVRDVEVQAAWAPERDTARLHPPVFMGEKEVDPSDAKRREANNVELTYVVMAGEDQPSFLARPALTIASSDQEAPPSPKEVPPQSPPTDSLALSESPQKSPPSPSR